MTPLTGLSANPAALPLSAASAHGPQQAGTFKNFLLESLEHVNSLQQDADLAVQQLMTGAEANPAEVLTAVQKADLSFRLMMQVRNKLMQALTELKEIRV